MQKLGGTIRETWRIGLRVLTAHPLVWLPFLCLAIAEGVWLSICYYAPRPPVSLVLAPLIRAFMGEEFLHYPLNFFVLPRLLFIGRVMFYLTLGIPAFIMTLLSVRQVLDNQPVRFWGNLNHALRRYGAVLCAAIIYGLGALLVYKVPRLILSWFFIKSAWFGVLHISIFGVSFILMIFLESLMIYVPHGIILNRQGVFRSIGASWILQRNIFPATFLFIFCFRCLNTVMIVMKNNLVLLIDRLAPAFPEFTLGILGLDILVMLVTNVFILVMVTLLFVETGKNNAQ